LQWFASGDIASIWAPSTLAWLIAGKIDLGGYMAVVRYFVRYEESALNVLGVLGVLGEYAGG